MKKYRTTLVVLYAVWDGQCKEALVGVTAVGRMGWKLAASLFIYALAKQNPSYVGWLAADNFCTRQDKKRQCFFGDFHVRSTSTSFKK